MSEYIQLLRSNRNYLYLWLGSVVTQLGDWFNLIASAELITTLTDSGTAISYLFIVRFLPLFLFSPLAGVLADKYNRKTLMIVSDVLRALIVLCFLLIRSADQLWLFYLLTIMQFALSALFTPARTATVANIVPQKDLITANALDSLTWSTMLALGALLGGLVAGIFGAETAFVADAGTFLLSAVLIWRIALPDSVKAPSESVSGGWFDFFDGFRYLWGQPFILGVALAKGFGSLAWGAINVVEVSFAETVFSLPEDFLGLFDDGGTATLGFIYMVSGLGTGLGPIVFRKWLGDSYPRLMWGIGLGFALMGLGIWGLGNATTLPIFLFMTAVRTIGTGTLWVFSAAMLQMITPDRYRGRVFAFEFAFLTLTQSVSIYAAGFVQDSLEYTLPQTTTLFAMIAFVVTLVWGVFHFASLRRATVLQS